MVAARGDADVVVNHFVDESVLPRDSAGRKALETVLQKFWLADSNIAVAVNVSK